MGTHSVPVPTRGRVPQATSAGPGRTRAFAGSLQRWQDLMVHSGDAAGARVVPPPLHLAALSRTEMWRARTLHPAFLAAHAAAEGAPVTFEPLCEASRAEAVAHVADIFSASEPLSVALSLNAAEWRDIMWPFAAPGVGTEVSVVCRERGEEGRRAGGGRVVGVCLATNFDAERAEAWPVVAPMRAASEKIATLCEFEEHVERPMSGACPPPPGVLCHMLTATVSPAYRRHHIARSLLARVMAAASRAGMVGAFCETTSLSSQRMLTRNFGFTVPAGGRVRYADWTRGGARPLAALTSKDAEFCDLAVSW